MSEQTQDEVLLTFLARTKDGEFAEVPPYTLEFVRITEEAESVYNEEEYIYTYC